MSDSEISERLQKSESAFRLVAESAFPTQIVTIATIDSAIGRKLGMQKGKRYVIALLGEAE